MKAWIQRVDEASVDIGGERVAEIGRGYLVLLGITHDDTERKARDLASRICGLRILVWHKGRSVYFSMGQTRKDVGNRRL